MTTSQFLSQRRSALAVAHLLFAAVYLALVSHAWAGDITYHIVNYPVNQADVVSPGTDTLSGTIVTDGTIGPLGPGNIVGGSLTMVTPNDTLTEQIDPSYPDTDLSTLTATPTQLLFTLNPAVYDDISLFFEPTSGPDVYMNLGYQESSRIYAGGIVIPDGPELGGFVVSNPPAVPGSIADSTPWVIATTAAVPEPDAFTLLGSALLGLGAVYRRRPRAKA